MDYELYTKVLLSQIGRDYSRMKFEAERKASEQRIMDIMISNLTEKGKAKIREERIALLNREIEIAKSELPPPLKED